jgi:exosortase/archaeosortase family protein
VAVVRAVARAICLHAGANIRAGLAYLGDSNPTLSGPDLDVTIVPECSGINGLELFDYLFGVVAVLDWNRLRKGRVLFAYGTGLFAMLLGNAIRITCFVFLVYLSMVYGWMLGKRDAAAQQQLTSTSQSGIIAPKLFPSAQNNRNAANIRTRLSVL